MFFIYSIIFLILSQVVVHFKRLYNIFRRNFVFIGVNLVYLIFRVYIHWIN